MSSPITRPTQRPASDNLAVRLGLPRAATLYAVVAAASWLGLLVSTRAGVPAVFLWLQAPFLVLSVALACLMAWGAWRRRESLELLCGGTLVIDLGVAAAYVATFLLDGA